MMAPVRVAQSTMAVAPHVLSAYTNASARVKRPSASVLLTPMVLPLAQRSRCRPANHGTDHVFARRDDEVGLDTGRFRLRDDFRGAQRGAGATHVKLHHLDHASRTSLQVVSARVKREPLTDDGHLFQIAARPLYVR